MSKSERLASLFRYLGGFAVALFLVTAPARAIVVYVTVGPTQTLTLEVEGSDTIENVRQKTGDKLGVPPDELRIYYNGLLLADNRTLADYDIIAGSTLAALLRLGARAGSLAETAAASQLGAVTDAVSVRVADRLAAPEADGSLTISTSGIAKAGGHWWVTGDLRQFSIAGAEDGSGGNLTFGIDRVTERGLLIGLYAGQHWLGIGDGTTDRVRSPALGVYLGVPVGPALVLDGHFGMARPKLETGGSTVASERFMAALGLAGAWTSGAVILSPSLRVSGYDEEVPAYLDDGLLREAERLRAWALTVGLRVSGAQAIGGTGLVPYGELSLARAMTRSDLAGTTGYSALRAALGLVGTVGAGALSAELSGGTLTDKVSDAGLRLSYRLEF